MSFDSFLRVWVWVAVPLSLLAIYLTVNKIWIRRHEKIVAESVSVAAKFVALFATLPYLLLYLSNGTVASAIKSVFVLATDAFLVLLGIGYWVEGSRGRGFWRNIKASLKLERKEVSVLLRDVFHQVAAKQLIGIMCNFAMIDKKFDQREREFIESFAKRWNVDIDKILADITESQKDNSATYANLRASVQEYLALTPSIDQARQLGEVLSLLAQTDNRLANEESVMLDELLGMIDNYTTGVSQAAYLVLIAPQSAQQSEKLAAAEPLFTQDKLLGGEVLRIGRYYSYVYAQMICQCYRDDGYLTVTMREQTEIVG